MSEQQGIRASSPATVRGLVFAVRCRSDKSREGVGFPGKMFRPALAALIVIDKVGEPVPHYRLRYLSIGGRYD